MTMPAHPDPVGSGTPGPSVASSRGRGLSPLDLLRGVFLIAAIGFGWWGLRGHHDQIVAAVGRISPVRVLGAGVIVALGLLVTAIVWRTVLGGFGHRVPPRAAASIFFVGQLGKYIPGSIWSLGAQADMARAHRVPARTTVAAGLVFLYVHVVSALPVAGALGRWEDRGPGVGESLPSLGPLESGITELPPWVVVAACALAVLLLSPPVLGLVGRILAGREQRLRVGWRDSGMLMALMVGAWVLYGMGVLLVMPPDDVQAAGGAAALLGPATAAFAAAHMVGVLIVLAPAGAGARELTLIGLLAPILGVPTATAAALLTRVVHTIDDFAVAALAWMVARRRLSGTDPIADGGPPAGPRSVGGHTVADGRDAGP